MAGSAYSMTKFYKRGDRTKTSQTFDVENTFIVQAGKKINVYDMIQENSEDTDIYKTLEKYSSLEKIEMDHEGAFAEIEEIQDLRDFQQKQERANNLWLNLPLEIREKFHNNPYEFQEKGKAWLEEIHAEKAKIEKEKEIEENKLKPVEIKEKINVA